MLNKDYLHATIVLFVLTMSGCGGDSAEKKVSSDSQADVSVQTRQPTPWSNDTPEEEVTSYTISVSWDIPVEREDGSILSQEEIKGYTVQYQLLGESNTEVVFVENQQSHSSGTAVVELLLATKGQYEFTVKTVDFENLESEPTAPQLLTL